MAHDYDEWAHRLTVDIRVWREHFLRDLKLTQYRQINEGQCENFALFVKDYNPGCELYGVEEFQKGDGSFDWDILAGWGIQCPAGYTEAELDRVGLGGHLWLAFHNRHYDAECPQGVSSFFELPFFQRQLEAARAPA